MLSLRGWRVHSLQEHQRDRNREEDAASRPQPPWASRDFDQDINWRERPNGGRGDRKTTQRRVAEEECHFTEEEWLARLKLRDNSDEGNGSSSKGGKESWKSQGRTRRKEGDQKKEFTNGGPI